MRNEKEWKQFMEGLSQQLIGPFEQKNIVDGEDCIREYWNKDKLVASMTVYQSNTNRPSYECVREFFIDEETYVKCSHIYIMTDEDWEEWDNADASFDDEEWLKEKIG